MERCLRSVLSIAQAAVYVDSGSTDASIAMARELGAEVVALDVSVPFTAALARNAGFQALIKAAPDLKYVQFVDGDCEIAAGWLDRARSEFESARMLQVTGRRREDFRKPRFTTACATSNGIPPSAKPLFVVGMQ